MKIRKWTYKHFYPRIGRAFILALTGLLHYRIIGYEKVKTLRDQNKRIVFVIWHGRQLLVVKLLSNRNVCVMTSTSRDGLLQSRILKKFGFEIVFGSSHKSPVRALVGIVKKMKEGFDVAMAVDGPTGPLYKVKPGAIFLAKKLDAYIVPLTFASHPAITLKAWDKYQLPLPFSRTSVIFGDPYKSSTDLSEEAVNEECMRIEELLNRLTEQAEKLVGRKGNQIL